MTNRSGGGSSGGAPSTGNTDHNKVRNNSSWDWSSRNNNNKEKKIFEGESKQPEMRGKVVTQDGGNRSFNETKDALAALANKRCPNLAYNIKNMITTVKTDIVVAKLDYSGCTMTLDGMKTTDID